VPQYGRDLPIWVGPLFFLKIKKVIFCVYLRTSHRAYVWHPSTLQHPLGIFLQGTFLFGNLPKHFYSPHWSTPQGITFAHTSSFLQFQQACLGMNCQEFSLYFLFMFFSSFVYFNSVPFSSLCTGNCNCSIQASIYQFFFLSIVLTWFWTSISSILVQILHL